VLNTATINPNDVRDQMQNQILNVHRRLDVLPFPTAVQVGGARRVQERDRRTRQERWTYAGIDGDRSPAPFLSSYQSTGARYGLQEIGVPWAAQHRAWQAWQTNPGLFQKTAQNAVDDETYRINNSEYIKETVSA